MTPPQLFLIKEQIIIPFGFPFALFGNWKKVILTEATVLIFWLYLIRQTVCPKKYTLEVSLDRCVWSVLISELYSLSPLSTTKKYSTFLLLSQFISQESSDQIIFLNFRLQFYKNTNMNRPSPNPFRLEWYMSDMFRFCVQDSNQKKSQRTSWSSKKILRKMTWNPNQSFVFTVIIQKKI